MRALLAWLVMCVATVAAAESRLVAVEFDGSAQEVLDNEDLRHEYLAI